MTVALFVVICFGIENAGGMENVKSVILGIDGIDNFGQYFNLFGTNAATFSSTPPISSSLPPSL